MQYGNVEVGDILFFVSRPDTDFQFAQASMKNQWWLSCLFCGCFSDDYRKTHVGVCVEKEEKGGIKVAHLRKEGYVMSSLAEPELAVRLKKDKYVIMRPHDVGFKKELVRLVSLKENKEIKWDFTSYDQSVACCGSKAEPDKNTTKAGFTIGSTCSRFAREAINIAAQNSHLPQFAISTENRGVMVLYWSLASSKSYQCLQQSSSEAKAELSSDKEMRSPLLP